MSEKQRVALVTGAAQGIGFAIAARLARDGHSVVLLDRDPQVQASADRLVAQGREARALCVDVANEADVLALRQCLGDWWLRLSVLVNAAGISPKHQGRKRPVAEMPTDEWQRVLAVNLTGSFWVTRACLPALCVHGWGRIVMVTSQAARTRTPVPGAHYAASKAGLTAFARVLAEEVADRGVTVNCVAPGRIESAMTGMVPGNVNEGHAKTIPAGRLGTVDEVAATVAFLVSDDAGYLTGATIDVNGGSFMT